MSVLVRVQPAAMVDVPTHLVHSPANVLMDMSSHMMDVTAEVTSSCNIVAVVVLEATRRFVP